MNAETTPADRAPNLPGRIEFDDNNPGKDQIQCRPVVPVVHWQRLYIQMKEPRWRGSFGGRRLRV